MSQNGNMLIKYSPTHPLDPYPTQHGLVTDKNTKLFQKFINVEFNITAQMCEVNMGQGR